MRSAIRHYQKDKNLAVTGRLDADTRKDLVIEGRKADDRAERRADRSADRTAGEADRSQAREERGAIAPSTEAVRAAQRRLHDKGLYKGGFDGQLGPETQAAIREYQKSSNLNTTGKLDQATLDRLGVSK